MYEYMNITAVPCTVLTVDSDEYWRCMIRHVTNPENHQVGTCKMGSSSDGEMRKLALALVEIVFLEYHLELV